ncbi:MAG: TIGR02646 family protein [bacterium]|nr:TIGR02646 family protein [bacterium]
MKYIQKGDEPESLKNWKTANIGLFPNPGLEHLTSGVKGDLKDSLLEDQGDICCYCGISIEDRDSHIEHFESQLVAPSKKLDYENLLASCSGASIPENSIKQEYPAIHCGHFRKRNEDLKISPLDTNCEEYFAFTYRGRVIPANGAKNKDSVQETIDKLGLNCERLKGMRKAAWDIIFKEDNLKGWKIRSGLMPKALLGKYANKEKGKYRQFCFVVIYVLNKYFSV